MKTISIIISVVVFVSMALALSGVGKLFVVIAMVLHAIHSVIAYGRNWKKERVIKGSFNPVTGKDKKAMKDDDNIMTQ